jgi:hypothetical protein
MQAGRDVSQLLATSMQTNTIRTGAMNTTNAARTAGTTAAAASNAGASRIVAAIWAARPVIQSTNVVNNYTTKQRTGSTSGSRDAGYVSKPGL